jgi:hypothetical protein
MTGTVVMYVLVPGLIGTIKSLFVNVQSDPSTQGRTADYGPVWHYIEERPLFGRGFGTFIPDLYRTLDNQYLGITVEVGLVGVAALLLLLVGSLIVAGRIRREARDDSTGDLAQSLKAGIAVVAVNAATFDAFGFSMCVGTLFLLIGATGALWLLESAPGLRPSPSHARETNWASGRIGQWRLASVGLAAVIALCQCVAVLDFLSPSTEYRAYAAAVLVPPQPPDDTAYRRSGNATRITSVLRDIMADRTVRDELRVQSGGTYEVAVGDGSLMTGSDIIGYGPTLRFVASDEQASDADQALALVLRETQERLGSLQTQMVGVPASEAIELEVIYADHAFPVAGRQPRALAGLLVLTSLCAAVLMRTHQRRRLRAWVPRHIRR